jgi:hypothetical protein
MRSESEGLAPHTLPPVQTILVTGAAGRIGGFLRAGMRRDGRRLRLLDTTAPTDLTDGEEAHTGSVTERDVVRRAVAGADAVVHLAGIPTEAAWEEIPRRERRRHPGRPARRRRGGRTNRRRRVEQPRGRLLVAARGRDAPGGRRPTTARLVLRVEQGGGGVLGAYVPRAVRDDRRERADRLVR